MRRLRVLAAVALSGWIATVGLLYWQHRAGTLHPLAFLFVSLLAVTLLTAVYGGVSGLWRFVRGPRRRGGLGWGIGALLPLVFWLSLAGYVRAEMGRGDAPNNFPFRLATVAGASVMEAEAHFRYNRLETEHLVMFYDERVTDPERDTAAMEDHVARLEKLVGKRLRAKIHWVRGTLLGMGRRAILGLALGSDFSPRDWDTADHPEHLSVDRHELAHAVLTQFYDLNTDPPFLLVEGWAESHSGTGPARRGAWALQSRQLWKERSGGPSYLRELVGPAWYHHIDGPVYNVGGAFAGYLQQRFGTARFLELYFACRPGNFERLCPELLGVEFEELERDFWLEAENTAR